MSKAPRMEQHRAQSTGWLRAAVLGANDGILSTASLVLGVAAAHRIRSNILIAGVAGLVAGAMSMASGEYVSVHSQADTEHTDIEREIAELKPTTRASMKNWPRSMLVAAWTPRSRNRLPTNSWCATR